MTPQQLQALQKQAKDYSITAAQAADYGPISDPATWERAIADAQALQNSYETPDSNDR